MAFDEAQNSERLSGTQTQFKEGAKYVKKYGQFLYHSMWNMFTDMILRSECIRKFHDIFKSNNEVESRYIQKSTVDIVNNRISTRANRS